MELPDTLECCYELIRLLAEENAVLRKSGDDFGRLAERINAALHEERRLAATYPVEIQGLGAFGIPAIGVHHEAVEAAVTAGFRLEALPGSAPVPFQTPAPRRCT